MIGMIVSGHGNFASGISSAMTLIGGKPTQFYAIDFVEGDTSETLEASMKTALEALKDCEGVIFCTDLAGGTPFKSACMVGVGMGNVEVIAGVNLPLCIELNLMRQFESDVKALADNMVATGKEQLLRFEFVPPKVTDHDDEDGI